jgi:hypothetical protein
MSRIEADTWEEINTALNRLATRRNLDDGKKVRIDTTGVDGAYGTGSHAPDARIRNQRERENIVRTKTLAKYARAARTTDASLLHDGIRVLCREMKKVLKRFPRIRFPYHDHTRASKKLYTKISLGKEKDRAGYYRQLVAYGEEVVELAPADAPRRPNIVTRQSAKSADRRTRG